MNTIALWICVCADDWAAESAIKASNGVDEIMLKESVTLTVRVNEVLNTIKNMETRKISESDETNTSDERKIISFVG